MMNDDPLDPARFAARFDLQPVDLVISWRQAEARPPDQPISVHVEEALPPAARQETGAVADARWGLKVDQLLGKRDLDDLFFEVIGLVAPMLPRPKTVYSDRDGSCQHPTHEGSFSPKVDPYVVGETTVSAAEADVADRVA